MALGLVLILLSVSGFAQSQSNKNGLLWKITGLGLSNPSYLYGTIHMICEKDLYISQPLKSAMNEVGGVVFELNLGDPELGLKMKQVMSSPVSLHERLKEGDYHLLDSLLQLKTSIPLKQFDYSSLMAVSSFLSSKMMLCGRPVSYESSLLALAESKQKKIAGFETPEQQMEFFCKAFPDSVLIGQMLDTKKNQALSEKLIDLYKLEAIEELSSSFDDPQVRKWILDIRNANWVKVMPGLMQKESTLFVVGAGHLGGEMGLIKSLRKLGYLLEPVKKE